MKNSNALLTGILIALVCAHARAGDPPKEQTPQTKTSSEEAFCKTLRQARPNAACASHDGKSNSQKFNEVLKQARPSRAASKASAASQAV